MLLSSCYEWRNWCYCQAAMNDEIDVIVKLLWMTKLMLLSSCYEWRNWCYCQAAMNDKIYVMSSCYEWRNLCYVKLLWMTKFMLLSSCYKWRNWSFRSRVRDHRILQVAPEDAPLPPTLGLTPEFHPRFRFITGLTDSTWK